MHKLVMLWVAMLAIAPAVLPVHAQKLTYRPRRTAAIPVGTAAGATRGGKCGDASCLVAVMPPNTVITADTKATIDHLPLTIADRPVFYVNIPNTNGLGRLRLFKLTNPSDRGQLIFSNTFKVESASGIARLALPQTAPALAVGSVYRWELMVGDLEREATVIGLVSRVQPDPSLTKALQSATPAKKAEILANAGIWLDAVDLLAVHSPQSLAELLRAVGLSAIANQPVQSCCSITK